MHWYLRRETGEQVGPVDEAAIVQEIRGGRVSPQCWVAPAGAPSWAPLLSVASFAAAFPQAASAPMTSAPATSAPADPNDPPTTTKVTTLAAPSAGIVVKKIIAAIFAAAIVAGIGLVIDAIFDVDWLAIVFAVIGLLGGALMIRGAFKGLVGACPYCGALVGGSATGTDLERSATPTTIACEKCGEYLTAQNGELRATDPTTVADAPTFECPVFAKGEWPQACVLCGAPPTRTEDLHAGSVSGAALLVGRLHTYSGSVKGVPHCAQHEHGVALKIEDEKLRFRFRSLRMMRRYVAANRRA